MWENKCVNVPVECLCKGYWKCVSSTLCEILCEEFVWVHEEKWMKDFERKKKGFIYYSNQQDYSSTGSF